MGEHVVVLDIGKTNKKMSVYDSGLNCLNPGDRGVRIESVGWTSPCGRRFVCDDMEGIHRWMLSSLKSAVDRFGDVGAVSISTHGATVALLGEGEGSVFDDDGGLAFPVVSYENDVTPAMEEQFYGEAGADPREAHRQTATPQLSWLLNAAKTVFVLKHTMPERFRRVRDVLMFPQYIGYLLCGEKGVEPTYPGCHSYFLDASGTGYSRMMENLGLTDLLPPLPMRDTWSELGRVRPAVAQQTGLSRDCIVTMGVHDSNAALVPYLARGLRDFVVQDSGTWVVTMAPRPGGEALLTEGEVGLEVFYNRDIYGDPVKTTIFRGGAEFEFYRNNVLPGRDHAEQVHDDIVREIVSERCVFALPTLEHGAGLFPASRARLIGTDTIFRDAATAWHVIDIGLAIQGYCAFRMASGDAAPSKAYIEGNIGRHNPVYRRMIASLLPGADVYWGSMGGAAFGAAILGVAATEGLRPEELCSRYDMPLQAVRRFDMEPELLKRYAEEFIALARA